MHGKARSAAQLGQSLAGAKQAPSRRQAGAKQAPSWTHCALLALLLLILALHSRIFGKFKGRAVAQEMTRLLRAKATKQK